MIKKFKIICIVPARKNSKGLKDKNILKLNGKELLYYPIKAAKNSKHVDKIILSSDSLKYLKIGKKYGVETPFLRPQKIALDKTKTYEVIKHTLNYLKDRNFFYDIVVCLEPTSPFTTSNDVDKALKKLIKTKSHSLVSITNSGKYSLDFHFKKNKNGQLNSIFSLKKTSRRRQDASISYVLDGSIYISFIDNFLENKGFISKKTFGYEFSKWKSIEIDNKFDLFQAKNLINYNENKKFN